ncbi:MAG: DUF4112 domain-containing protein [Sphingobacteriaceae bacterium]|nr:MAG: DUF4112 domain-containing protein [Sphingobacteriaceae bacterium]
MNNPNLQNTNLTGRLKWVERISGLMDDQFKLPGSNFRFGLDPLLNLIPFVGDISGFLVGAALVLVMAKNGVSRKVVILMVVNICIDALLGGIPLIGNVFDFYYKSNSRNIQLLKEHYEEGKHQGSGTGVLLAVFIVLFLLFAGFLYLMFLVASWIWRMV